MSSSFRSPAAAAALALTLALAGCGDGPTEPPPPVGAVIVTSVAPELLRPGDEAVIEGENFAPEPENNVVRIHGLRVPVLEASRTSLRIRIPESLCLPRGPVPVVVHVGESASEPVIRAFEPDRTFELAPGEIRRLTSADDLCMILEGSDSPAEYLVGTQSTSGSAGVMTSVLLRGRTPLGDAAAVAAAAVAGPAAVAPTAVAPSAAAPAPAAPTATAPSTAAPAATPPTATNNSRRHAPGGGSAGPLEPRWERHLRAETRLRRKDGRALEALAAPARGLTPPTPAAARAASVPPDVSPGDTVSLTVPYIGPDDDRNPCDDGEPIRALVRRVGDNSIWLEDVANPPGGFTSSDYDLLSDEFDNVIYDEVVDYFGEPTDVDDNDRIVIVVSHEVNRMSRALAFVVASDFFPAQCPGANGGEYYYARAPDPGGSIPGPEGETFAYSRSDALSDAPRLLAHEVTHIIQFGRRLQLPSPDGAFQAIWLLEGQATFAEEVVGHRYSGHEPGRNLGAGPAMQEVFPPTQVPWYRAPFVDLAVYFGFGRENGAIFRVEGAPEECSWLSFENPEPCISGRIAYGVTWSFIRWAADHFGHRFGGGEREFQRRIVDSPRTGFQTFEEVLGEDMPELLAPWAAMLYTDGRLGVAGGDFDPLLTFPSWDLRDIENTLVDQARLVPTFRLFSDYDDSVDVAAASSHYQLVRTTTGHPPFALSARTLGENPLPAFMQLWVVRLR
jgi:hypothetical protein